MTETTIEFDFTRRPHPLLIPSIIFKILSNKAYLELKLLRLVCSQWEYEASTLLQQKTQIRLSTEDQVENYLKQYREQRRNRACHSFEFGVNLFIKSPVVQQFFSGHGNEVKSLKLHSAEWSNLQLWELLSIQLPHLEELSLRIFIPKYGHLYPEVIDNQLPKLYNIKKLNLNFCIDQPDIYFTNPTILKELFLALPNLETLSCPNWPTIILPSTTVCTLVFNVILSEPEIKFDRLSNLFITANLSNTEIHSLLNKKFPLRELRLEISPSIRWFYLQCLLMSLEDTLTSLSLTFPYYYETWQFEILPRLKNLKFLSLHKYQGSLEIVVEKLSALKTLVLTDVSLFDVEHDPEDGNGPNPADPQENGAVPEVVDIVQVATVASNHLLEELNIEDKNDSPIGLIKHLVKLFPNLKRLRMENVNDSVLRFVFGKLTSLECLVLQGEFTDSGVTGIPLDVCKDVLDDDELVVSAEELDELREFSYVGDLKNLQKLILDSDMMTYLSILYGVKDCKKLSFQSISSMKLISRIQGVWGSYIP